MTPGRPLSICLPPRVIQKEVGLRGNVHHRLTGSGPGAIMMHSVSDLTDLTWQNRYADANTEIMQARQKQTSNSNRGYIHAFWLSASSTSNALHYITHHVSCRMRIMHCNGSISAWVGILSSGSIRSACVGILPSGSIRSACVGILSGNNLE